jgi:8-oxo-dGTP diphosphatase
MQRLSAKLWLKSGEASIIGSGRARLLRAIDEYGSITKAAESMNMSYRHAWGILRMIRDAVGEEIITTSRGGKSGGGAQLTAYGRQLLRQFDDNEHLIKRLLKYGPRPALTVDGVIFDDSGKLVLIRRKNPPFKGQLALPGGFVENNETTEDAIRREIKEEVGINVKIKRLIGVYSDPSRDPRQHIVSVVYELEAESMKLKAGDDAAAVELVVPEKILKSGTIGFDHSKIISDAIRLRAKDE